MRNIGDVFNRMLREANENMTHDGAPTSVIELFCGETRDCVRNPRGIVNWLHSSGWLVVAVLACVGGVPLAKSTGSTTPHAGSSPSNMHKASPSPSSSREFRLVFGKR